MGPNKTGAFMFMTFVTSNIVELSICGFARANPELYLYFFRIFLAHVQVSSVKGADILGCKEAEVIFLGSLSKILSTVCLEHASSLILTHF